MKAIWDFMNGLTDMDWGWWPMLRCRPPKDKNIDARVLLKITPVFGTMAGLFAVAVTRTFNSLYFFVGAIAVSWVLFFVIYRITFAVTWNRRAKTIRENRIETPTSASSNRVQ